jgi:uncharacterized protein (UPF0335 family)
MDKIVNESQDKQYRVSSSELKSFVERYEKIEEQKKDLLEFQREILNEANATGYDTKILKKLISIRKKDPAVIDQEEAVMELYKTALGM